MLFADKDAPAAGLLSKLNICIFNEGTFAARCYREEEVVRFGYGLLHHVNGVLGSAGDFVENVLSVPARHILNAGVGNYDALVDVAHKLLFPNAGRSTGKDLSVEPHIHYSPRYGRNVFEHYLITLKCFHAGVVCYKTNSENNNTNNTTFNDEDYKTHITNEQCVDAAQKEKADKFLETTVAKSNAVLRSEKTFVSIDNALYYCASTAQAVHAVSYKDDTEDNEYDLYNTCKIVVIKSGGTNKFHYITSQELDTNAREATLPDTVTRDCRQDGCYAQMIVSSNYNNNNSYYILEMNTNTLLKLDYDKDNKSKPFLFKCQRTSNLRMAIDYVFKQGITGLTGEGNLRCVLLKHTTTSDSSSTPLSIVPKNDWSMEFGTSNVNIKSRKKMQKLWEELKTNAAEGLSKLTSPVMSGLKYVFNNIPIGGGRPLTMKRLHRPSQLKLRHTKKVVSSTNPRALHKRQNWHTHKRTRPIRKSVTRRRRRKQVRTIRS